MPAYRCYSPLCRELRAAIIEAPSSFEARKVYASMHSAMEIVDVVAIRIWEAPEDTNDES
jgi:hypothetical protein